MISQDCDVVHKSYSKEPYFEVIRAEAVGEFDGAYRYARNPRRLQLPVDWEGVSSPYQVSINDRAVVDRHLLETEAPDPRARLAKGAVQMLANWVASRYVREAFPDEFQRRLDNRKQFERLKTLLRREGELITGVFLRLNTQEDIAPTENYKVIVRVTVRSDPFENERERLRLEANFLEPFVEILQACQGIEVVDAQLVSEADFSLEDLQNTQRMSFDSYSYEEDPPGETTRTK